MGSGFAGGVCSKIPLKKIYLGLVTAPDEFHPNSHPYEKMNMGMGFAGGVCYKIHRHEKMFMGLGFCY